MKTALFLFLIALATEAFADSSLSCERYNIGSPSHGRRLVCTWTADPLSALFTATYINLGGIVSRVVTNPGSPAPTDDYDVKCGDPSDTTVDVFDGDLMNRDQTNTEQVYPVATNATMPVHAPPQCQLQITGNSVSEATGTVEFYILYP